MLVSCWLGWGNHPENGCNDVSFELGNQNTLPRCAVEQCPKLRWWMGWFFRSPENTPSEHFLSISSWKKPSDLVAHWFMGWPWGSGEWHLLIPFTRIKATPSQRSLPTIRSIIRSIIIIISIRAYSTTFIKRCFCMFLYHCIMLYCIIYIYFYHIILLGGHIGRVAWIRIMLVGVSNGTSPASVAVPQAAPKVVPPRAPKEVPQEPVIRRGQVTIFPIASAFDDLSDLLQIMCPAGPVLKNAEPQPPPDMDASWLVLAKPGWFGRIMVNVLKGWYYVWTSAMMAPSVLTISWFQPQHLGKRWKTQNPEVKWSEVKWSR